MVIAPCWVGLLVGGGLDVGQAHVLDGREQSLGGIALGHKGIHSRFQCHSACFGVSTESDHAQIWTEGTQRGDGEVPEGFVQRALAMGWRVGFTGGGDDHSGHPGDERVRGAGQWSYKGGLFSTQAANRTREAIWEALYERRCVATTGPRIIVEFEVAGAPMGSELSLADRAELADGLRPEQWTR